LFSQSGTAGFVQSASFLHSPQPDDTQKRSAPEPEQAEPVPQPQARLVQALVVRGSQPPLVQALHWVVLVRMHCSALAASQHSWLPVQPRDESVGSQALH
jgi:hypothetical protein